MENDWLTDGRAEDLIKKLLVNNERLMKQVGDLQRSQWKERRKAMAGAVRDYGGHQNRLTPEEYARWIDEEEEY